MVIKKIKKVSELRRKWETDLRHLPEPNRAAGSTPRRLRPFALALTRRRTPSVSGSSPVTTAVARPFQPPSASARPPGPFLRTSPPAAAAPTVAPSFAAPSHRTQFSWPQQASSASCSRPTKWALRAATSPHSYLSAAAAAACSSGRHTSFASQWLVVGGVGGRTEAEGEGRWGDKL